MATASVSASVLEFMGWLTDYMLKASWSTLTAWAPTTPKVTWTWTLIPTHHNVPNTPNTPDQVRDLCAGTSPSRQSEFCISDLIWLNDVFRFKHSCSGCCSEVKPGSSWSSLRHWSQPAGSSLSEVWFHSDEYRLLPCFCPPLIDSALRLSGESNLRHLDVSRRSETPEKKDPVLHSDWSVWNDCALSGIVLCSL